MRGKYSKPAAVRREAAEQAGVVEGYQRQVVRLTGERDDARAQLARETEASRRRIRTLEAMVREGTSARVAALEHEVRRLLQERDEARATVQKAKNNDRAGVLLLARHFRDEHDMNIEDALALTLTLVGGEPRGTIVNDTEERFAARYGVDALREIRRARGQGRPANEAVQ